MGPGEDRPLGRVVEELPQRQALPRWSRPPPPARSSRARGHRPGRRDRRPGRKGIRHAPSRCAGWPAGREGSLRVPRGQARRRPAHPVGAGWRGPSGRPSSRSRPQGITRWPRRRKQARTAPPSLQAILASSARRMDDGTPPIVEYQPGNTPSAAVFRRAILCSSCAMPPRPAHRYSRIPSGDHGAQLSPRPGRTLGCPKALLPQWSVRSSLGCTGFEPATFGPQPNGFRCLFGSEYPQVSTLVPGPWTICTYRTVHRVPKR